MTVREIRKMINLRGIEVTLKGKRKSDLIHIIQRDEKNTDCFATSYSNACGQEKCLWRKDCLRADKA